MRTNYIKHIRIVYSLFAGILLICCVLFFSNIITSEDTPQVGGIAKHNSDYAFTITNLNAGVPLYNNEHPIENTPAGIKAHAHISQFDMDFYTRDEATRNDARIGWIMALQAVQIICFTAIIVLVIITLITFYRSAKQGHVFPEKKISLLLIIGILLVVLSLCTDTSTYLERTLALELLRDTAWMPEAHYTIHFTRIFFGLTLIFLSQIFRIGRELQEDQELTI